MQGVNPKEKCPLFPPGWNVPSWSLNAYTVPAVGLGIKAGRLVDSGRHGNTGPPTQCEIDDPFRWMGPDRQLRLK